MNIWRVCRDCPDYLYDTNYELVWIWQPRMNMHVSTNKDSLPFYSPIKFWVIITLYIKQRPLL